MQDFTIQELYDMSDALGERIKRLERLQSEAHMQGSGKLSSMIRTAESAYSKVQQRIVDHISKI